MSDASGRVRLRGFYFITDSHLTVRGVIEDVREALSAGVVLVQYREKNKPYDARRAEAGELLALARAAAVPLIVNDDIALAKVIGADGVHLGQEDASPALARGELGPGALVGGWVGNSKEARAAASAGAGDVAASPVFETATKADAGPGIGIDGVRAIREATALPVVAIGGLTEENIPGVVAAGADMICAISASLAGGGPGDVARNVARLVAAMGR